MDTPPLSITTTDTILVVVDNVTIEFFAEPAEAPLLALLEVQERAAASPTPADQIRLIGSLRDCLRGLTVPASHDVFDQLHANNKLNVRVLMQVFTHLMELYGAALGFQSGLPSKSSDGQPENAATSPE